MGNNRPYAVVTGGSRGIGLNIALRLLENGWRVATAARWSDGFPSEEDCPNGMTPIHYDAALHDLSSIDAFMDEVYDQNEGELPQLVVLGAGVAAARETWRLVVPLLLINLVAPVVLTYRLLHEWKRMEKPWLTICYMGSYVEKIPAYGSNVYSITKIAQAVLAWRLRRQYRGEPIHFMIASPGVVNTSIWEHQETMQPWFKTVMAHLGTDVEVCAHQIVEDILHFRKRSLPTPDARLVWIPVIGWFAVRLYEALRYMGYNPKQVYDEWLAKRLWGTRWAYDLMRNQLYRWSLRIQARQAKEAV